MTYKVSAQQINDFLSLFDDDPIAAVHAIRDHAHTLHPILHKENPFLANKVLISVKSVKKAYKLGRQYVTALNDVSLDIHEGEFIALTGPSGSGKSTLLQLIGCLDKPTSGDIVLDEQNITRLSDANLSNLRQTTIGFVFQSFYLQPFLKVDDNVAVPAMFKGLKAGDITQRVSSLLERVDLSERSKHYPKELSGGQMQRAAIARALMNNPKILLADEPTGNLDSKNSTAIIDLFQEIRSRLGMTIIVVTHNPEVAAKADRVIELRDGVIL